MLERRKLEKEITKSFSFICIRKNNIEFVQESMLKQHGYPKHKSAEVLMGIKPVSELPDDELFWFTQGVNDFIKQKKQSHPLISLEDYYTNVERTAYKNRQWTTVEEQTYPVVFENFIQISEDQWVGVLDIDILYKLYQKQVIRYNKNTQRNLIFKVRNGVRYGTINVKKQAVREIKDLMEKNLFIPNTISLNLNIDNDELDFYIEDNKNGTCSIVLQEGQLDMIDGYHRFRAMIDAKAENENFQYKSIVEIMNFDEQKANAFIAQEDKRNPIDKQHSQSLDANNPVYLTISKLNTDVTSALYGYIGNDLLIEHSYLFALIQASFQIKDRKEALNTAKHIKNVINILVDKECIVIEKLDQIQTAVIIVGSSLHTDEMECAELIEEALQHTEDLTFKRFTGKVNAPFMKRMINYLEKFDK